MLTVRAVNPDGLHMLLIGLTPAEVNRLKNEPGMICEGTLPEMTSVQVIGVTTVTRAEAIAAQLRTPPKSRACGFAGDGPHYLCLLCGEEGIKHSGIECKDPACGICRPSPSGPEKP